MRLLGLNGNNECVLKMFARYHRHWEPLSQMLLPILRKNLGDHALGSLLFRHKCPPELRMIMMRMKIIPTPKGMCRCSTRKKQRASTN